jgi:hypothetical protein
LETRVSNLRKLISQEPHDGVSKLEFYLVAVVVAQALFNPCVYHFSHGTFSDTFPPVVAPLDLERYSDRVKNSRVRKDGGLSSADQNLWDYFQRPAIEDLSDPAIFLDRHGRIAVWHLTDILHQKRVVSSPLDIYL